MLHSRQPQKLGLFGLLLALSLVHVSLPAQAPEPSPTEPSPVPELPPPPPPPPPPAPTPSSPLDRADLTLTATVASNPVTAEPVTTGGQLTYTLVIQNNGPGSATGATLTDNLPASVTPGAVTTTQGSCGGTDPIRLQPRRDQAAPRSP